MADTPSPLDQLADISEPLLQTGFALAPAWWLLLASVIFALLYILLRLYKRWRYFAAKRQALRLLEQISPEPDAAAHINQLLKRVLQHYQPSHPALTLPTQQWQSWLAQQHSKPLPDLTRLLYQAGRDSSANEQFYQFAKTWLSNYRGQAATNLTEVING